MAKVRIAAVVVAVASTVLVSGCAAAPVDVGRPLDGQSLAAYYDERWVAVSPILPAIIRPEVAPVEVVDDGSWITALVSCLSDYGIAGTRPDTFPFSEFVCEQQYPSQSGIELDRTEEQRAVLEAWVQSTLIPCLRLEGMPRPRDPAVPVDFPYTFTWRANDPANRDPGAAFRLARCPAPDNLSG